MALLAFALDGEDPVGLDAMQEMFFVMARPHLQASRKKAFAASKSKSKNKEKEEDKVKNEIENKAKLKSKDNSLNGEDVRAMQLLLIGRGVSCGSSGADGSFGPATDKAVRKYQEQKRLQVDGRCGPATMGSLLGV